MQLSIQLDRYDLNICYHVQTVTMLSISVKSLNPANMICLLRAIVIYALWTMNHSTGDIRVTKWGAESTWLTGVPPEVGNHVIISSGNNIHVDVCPPCLSSITIEEGASLMWGDVKENSLCVGIILNRGHLDIDMEIGACNYTLCITDHDLTSWRVWNEKQLFPAVTCNCIRRSKFTRERFGVGQKMAITNLNAENEIKSNIMAPDYLYVGDCGMKGRGVFTKICLPKSSYIVFYHGKRFTEDPYNDADPQNDDSVYIFIIAITGRKTVWIDALEEDGSYGRLMNDNHIDPNVESRVVYADNEAHIGFFASRDIKADEELTFDYGPYYENFSWRTETIDVIT